MKFSAYRNIRTTVPYGELDLERFVELVRDPSERIQGILTAARKAYAAGNKAEYDRQKAELWCVTPWGCFTQRKADACKTKSGVFVLDIDGHDQKLKKTPAQWAALRDGLKATGKFAAGFISPSGDGLKLFVRVAEAATPLGTVKEVAAYLEKNWMVDADESGKDASRACFVSWDSAAFYLETSEVWAGKEPTHYTLDESKSAFAKVVTDATAEEIAEDEDARFVRYLNTLATVRRMDYAEWYQTIEACVGKWGVSRAVQEMTSRWPDEKPGETADKAAHCNHCENPHGSLWVVMERLGLVGEVRQENKEIFKAQKKAELATQRAEKAVQKAEVAHQKARAAAEEEQTTRAKVFQQLQDKLNRLKSMADPDFDAGWDGLSDDLRAALQIAAEVRTRGIFYDGPNRYAFDAGKNYIIKGQSDIKETLKLRGFRDKAENGETLSEVNFALQYIQNNKYLSYSGALAGKKKGLYTYNTQQILATSSPELIEPEEGECPLLDEIIDGLLGVDDPEEAEKQKRFLFGWLQCAYSSLSKGWWRPGQALVLAGEANSGKSLLKSIIVKLLGNRTADPFSYMTGETRFNANLAGAECLCIDDATGTTDVKTRKHVAAKIKSMLFSKSISVESKGRDPFQFEPFWRLIFCVNDDPESLLVLPVMSTDMVDKIALLQCKKWTCSIPNNTDAERHAFDERLQKELPAFLHKVMNFKIRDNEKEDRCGVKYYHNKDLLEAMNAVSPEDEFLGLVDEIGNTDLAVYEEVRSPKEWERLISEKGNVSQIRELQRLCGWGRASSIIFSRLFKERWGICQRVRKTKGYYYRIFSPEERERKKQEKVIEEYKSSGHWFEVGEQVVLASDTHDWGTEVTNARNGDVGVIVGRNDDTNSYQVRNLEWSKVQNAEGDFPTGVITCGGGLLRRLPAETGD